MNKVLLTVSKGILILALLSVFAAAVRHVNMGGERLGFLTKPLRTFSEFPTLANQVFEEATDVRNSPFDIVADTAFRPYNGLDYDLYALNATSQEDAYTYRLYNLRNDSTLYAWRFSHDYSSGPAVYFPVAHPLNPILLEDSSIVGMLYGSNDLFRLDKHSQLIWQNASALFHHSLNLTHDGHLWACGWDKARTHNAHSSDYTTFQDEFLLKIAVATGEVVFKKSLSEILVENGYINLIHGFANAEVDTGREVFHMNDIQPITTEGPYWQIGDLLLSLRHRSMILHYRPATNNILRIISGPFLSQHDVDVISDHTISIFNNNQTATYSSNSTDRASPTLTKLISSQVVVYDFADSSFHTPHLAVLEREKVFTYRQGMHTFLSNGDLFVESTEEGKIFLIRGDEVL